MKQAAGVRGWQPSWLPADLPVTIEALIHPHTHDEHADLFLAHNPGSTEVEVLNWLHATICLTKPASILETGAFDGLGTIALAAACRDNGFGTVHSVEIDKTACDRLTTRLQKYGLADWVKVHCADSCTFLRQTDLTFDFGFFDSASDIRADEYRICLERKIINGVAAFHDTSALRPKSMPDNPPAAVQDEYRRKLKELADDPRHSGHFEHVLSRGLFVIFPRSAPIPKTPPAQAETILRGLVEHSASDTNAMVLLGRQLLFRGNWPASLSAYQIACASSPRDAVIRREYGSALSTCGLYVQALRAHEQALKLAPDDTDIIFSRAQAHQQLCLIEEALADYDAVLAKKPDLPEVVGFRTVALNYRRDQAEIMAESKRYGTLVGLPRRELTARKHKKLRIGFLSPDLRQHSVTYFLRPLLSRKPEGVDIYTYYDNVHADAVTELIERQATAARRVAAFSNDELEKLLLLDELDILIDLAGHFGRHRLPILAHRVAPVQVTGIGYPNTTGVPAMDWRLADPVADAGLLDHYTERLLDLPRGLWAYLPPDDAPGVAPTPGKPLLGYFGLLSKITPEVASVWAQAIAAADADLLIKGDALENQEFVEIWTKRLSSWGLDMRRVRLRGKTQSTKEHLNLYADVTVALDTWPYGGTVTTCEALWSGVPVVTMVGKRHASRVGLSLLKGAGLPEAWAAKDTAAYVAAVVELIKCPVRLSRTDLVAAGWMRHRDVAEDFWSAITKLVP